ncbi:MAG: ABC transporter permease [Ardenticatenaceae bacterium]|nr:ABC transporter permease [Ardenticatenaceae bacterium]
MSQSSKKYLTSPRWLKVFLDIWENRSRTALVVASIAIGVFAVGMIVSTYVILSQDMESSYRAVNPANIEIITDPFDDDFIKTVARIPGVSQVEGRHRTSMRISQDQGATWRNLTVIALDDFERSEIFLRQLTAGQSIPDTKEILIEGRILEQFDIALGETLLIELPSDTQRNAQVAGIVRDLSAPGGPNAPAIAYINFDTLIWLGEEPVYNQLLVTVEGDSDSDANIEAVSQRVEDRIEQNGGQLFNVTTNKTSEHPASTTVLAMLGVLGAMGGLMLVLGGSLIANTLTALLNQQMRQIGVMKLVGARSLQVVGMYLVLIIILGLISLLVSIPLAGWGGYAFANFFTRLLNIDLGPFRFVPAAIVVQVIIAIAIPILSGIIPVITGSRLTVEEAISDGGGGNVVGRESWFVKLGESFDWISRPVLISLRNTFRNMRRLLLTLFTLTVAGAIFIAVFNVQASLTNFIGQISNLFIADVSIDLSRPYRELEISGLIESQPGVVDSEGWLSAAGEMSRDGGESDDTINFSIQAPPAGSQLVQPGLKEGRFLQPGDERALVVSETIWGEFPDIRAGDTLQIGINGGREETWTIVGIYAFPAPNAEAILSYVPYETIARLTNRVGKVTTLKVVTERQSLAAQEKYANSFDTQLRREGIRITNIEAGKTTTESVSEGIATIVSLFLGMAILTAIVGSIGLAGTMSMNVMERIREIGILRAIGAVDRAVMGSVLIEGIFIGILSWLLGIVLSFPISYGLLSLVSSALTNSAMPLKISPTGFWLWLVVIVILSALASIIPARNASQLTIREVLAYE